VIGVHTPEFSFEHETDRVRQAIAEREIEYPVVIDNNYAIWRASTRLSQEPEVGVKCTTIRGLRASQACTFGCLWVA
jgi:hypothetical protein